MISMIEAYSEAVACHAVAYWEYLRDPVGNAETYTSWNNLTTLAADEYLSVQREGLLGPNGDLIRELMGDEDADSFLETETLTDEQISLSQREAAVVFRYGTTYDIEEVTRIYLELVDVRKDIAASYGYDSYNNYAYEVLNGRKYSPDDAARLVDSVSSTFSDLYWEMYDLAARNMPTYTYTDEARFLSDMASFFHDIGYGELYDHMVDNGLIDFEDMDTKMNSTVTLTVTGTDEYYLYICAKPTVDYNDIWTLVHEYGHAMASYTDPVITIETDVTEINSQGLELLFALRCDDILGDEVDKYRLYELFKMTYLVLDACLHDEFQRQVYDGDYDSFEELEAIYQSIQEDIGYSTFTAWYEIPHNFANPLYYISYGVFAFRALDIMMDATEDYDSAMDLYRDILGYSGSYSDLDDEFGMLDIFDPQDVAYLADKVGAYFDTLADRL